MSIHVNCRYYEVLDLSVYLGICRGLETKNRIQGRKLNMVGDRVTRDMKGGGKMRAARV